MSTGHTNRHNEQHLHALPAGTRIEDYVIEDMLGKGGFGMTYRAWDETLGMQVAIKEYLPTDIAGRDGLETVRPVTASAEGDYRQGMRDFLNEARLLATFEHPNIVSVLRYFEANGTAYLVMPFQEGLNLFQHVRRHGRLDETALQALIGPMMDGLETVHAAGMLHRDIKPENILVSPDGEPTLIDFGAARASMAGRSRSVTTIVTPRYSPLEQYSGRGNQGPWSDVYALGAVIHWALTGNPPPEATDRAISDNYRSLVRLAELGPDAMTEAGMDVANQNQMLLQAVDRALALRVEDRPQSIAEFRAEMCGEILELDGEVNDATLRQGSDTNAMANANKMAKTASKSGAANSGAVNQAALVATKSFSPMAVLATALLIGSCTVGGGIYAYPMLGSSSGAPNHVVSPIVAAPTAPPPVVMAPKPKIAVKKAAPKPDALAAQKKLAAKKLAAKKLAAKKVAAKKLAEKKLAAKKAAVRKAAEKKAAVQRAQDRADALAAAETSQRAADRAAAEAEDRRRAAKKAAAAQREAELREADRQAWLDTERARKRAESQARLRAAAKRLAAEIARRKAADRATKRAEAEHLAAEDRRNAKAEARRKAKAEARRKAKAEADARRNAAADADARRAAEDRRNAKAEARRKAKAEAEARRNAAADAGARRAAEERRKAKAEARRKAKAEAEARRNAAADADARRAAEERRKAKAEARRKAKAEARRKAKAEAEARRNAAADADARRAAEERRKSKAEARRKAKVEAEARRNAAADADAHSAAEERRKTKAEARAKAKTEAKRKAAAKAEAERKAAAKAEAKRKASAKRKAEARKRALAARLSLKTGSLETAGKAKRTGVKLPGSY